MRFNEACWLEEATDEIARLDSLALHAPASARLALWLLSLSDLIDATPDSLHALTAATADSFHESALSERARSWRAVLIAEERRVRSGAVLTAARFTSVDPTLGSYANRERLETIWREQTQARPVLVRAIDSAAWAPDRELGELSAALLLCAGGRVDRVRLLPFAAVNGEVRAAAVDAWRNGETEPWMRVAFEGVARRARRLREAFAPLVTAPSRDEDALAPLGRAAITARRAAAEVRDGFAVTIPSLADRLGTSRPAAADAIERLVSIGLVREITGRARDRVYAYEAALSMAESSLLS